MITLDLTIGKKKEIKENESKYDFQIKIDNKIFHLTPRQDDIRLIDYLLDNSDEYPEEVTVDKRYFENTQSESVRFYAINFKIEDDEYYLNVEKADRKLFNFLIDKIDKKDGENIPF